MKHTTLSQRKTLRTLEKQWKIFVIDASPICLTTAGFCACQRTLSASRGQDRGERKRLTLYLHSPNCKSFLKFCILDNALPALRWKHLHCPVWNFLWPKGSVQSCIVQTGNSRKQVSPGGAPNWDRCKVEEECLSSEITKIHSTSSS